jgi:hypothetical protein
MGNKSKYEQVQVLQNKRLETVWDQVYQQGFFDPEGAKKVWEGECGNGKERLYLTKHDNWIIEDVDAYGEGHSRFLEIPDDRAHSWLAMLSDEERGDWELVGEL